MNRTKVTKILPGAVLTSIVAIRPANRADHTRLAAMLILALIIWGGSFRQVLAQATPGFVPVGNLNIARVYHTATLLRDGSVLITGGQVGPGGSALASTELYNPTSRNFSLGNPLNSPRWFHTATLLNDGRVLIAGGQAPGSNLASAELFDPASGRFTLTGPMVAPFGIPTAALLPDGRVLLVGAENDSGVSDVAEIFDPTTGQFTATGRLNQSREEPTATLLSDGRVLIAGGVADTPSFHVLSTAEIFDPTTGLFQLLGGQMVYTRGGDSAVRLPNGTVLLAGGQGPSGLPLGYWVNIPAEIFDLTTGTFSATGTPLAGPRAQATLTGLNDGQVLLVGGEFYNIGNIRESFASAELYNPSTGVFTPAGSLGLACSAHTATLLPDGNVLIAGGLGDKSIGFASLSQAALFRECQSAPTIACPGDVVVNTDPGQCQASHVSLGVPATADACGTTMVINDAPPVFQKGTTVVTWTVSDAFGATAACRQNVIVVDKEPPKIACPANIMLGCGVDLLTPATFSVTATDNCDLAPIVNSSPTPGSGFAVGTTTVNCSAIDASGNQSTCSFTVTRAPLGFSGFLAPVGGADATGGSFASPLRTFKIGSTIPVKFTAACSGSAVLTGSHSLQAAKYSDATTGATAIDATPPGEANSGDLFSLVGGQWQFNLDTKATGMSVGIWQLVATLSDGSQHTVWIQLK